MNEKRYVEFIEGGAYHSHNFVDIRSISKARRDVEAYTSMYIYDDELIQHLQNQLNNNVKTPSIKGFRGGMYINYLWIDIDVKDKEGNGDINKAIIYAKFCIEKINNKYELPYDSMVMYFSGSKGFHIGIPAVCFGALNKKYDKLPAASKLMVESIVDSQPMYDPVIYDSTRFFRIANSKHAKTGLYKTEIDYNLILEANVEKILELAKENKVDLPYKYTFVVNDKLKVLFEECIANAEVKSEAIGEMAIGKITENKSVFSMPAAGHRNHELMRMAFRLFSVPNVYLKNQEVVDLMNFIVYSINNLYATDPLSQREVDTTIRHMYNETRAKAINQFEVEDVSAMVMQVYLQIKNAKHVSTLLSKFNRDLGGGFANQDLYCIIGKGGTMKSYWLQDLQMHSSVHEAETNLYLNMEMSRKLFFERAFSKFVGNSFAEAIKQGQVNDTNIQEIEEKIKGIFESRFLIVSKNNIQANEVGDIINRKQDELKIKIKSVVCDSMNAMKGGDAKGGETAAAFEITKDLKEVAKNTNTAIMLINHARNDCPVETRDCSDYCRGGSKPIDNCDAHFSLSRIMDREASNLEAKDYVYKAGYVYVRLVNKRNSGNTIDRICRLNEEFSIEDTNLETRGIEIKI